MNSLKSFGNFIEKLLTQLKDEIYNNAPFDKTKRGRITEKINPRKYRVEIGGRIFVVRSSAEFKVNDIVWVRIPCGDETNMYIDPISN